RQGRRGERGGDGVAQNAGTPARTGDQGGFGGFGGAGGGRADVTMLWMLDEAGQVTMLPVRTGISDGQTTQIIPLRGALEPGAQIIAGVTVSAEDEGATNPFQSNNQGGRRRFGGF
ncbi:MAG: hypothetical protein R3247_08010, partial [Rhodothermales bacterium]|nr:hypothetical protein [Rhodothermales bacterium]